MANLYLGLISGTSMDGVDTVLAEISNDQCHTIGFLTLPYEESLLLELKSLCVEGDNEINRVAQADRKVAKHFAKSVSKLLEIEGVSAESVRLIGSHGQTVRHFPTGDCGFSMQIGDPNSIAALTEIDVIADFRRKDIALGGQGAPLVPAFHHAVFSNADENRVILNIGGIANITYLPKGADVEDIIGYDTGPGNRLLDAWCKLHTGNEYDNNGEWAKSGECQEALLKGLLSLDYFKAPAPKSTGREQFNLEWLTQLLTVQPEKIPAQDVQHTLLLLTAITIADQIKLLSDVDSIYVCGGGAHNKFLMQEIAKLLPNIKLATTEALGINADAVEALAFAWLAYAYDNNLPGNVPAVTGASRKAILGGLFKAQ